MSNKLIMALTGVAILVASVAGDYAFPSTKPLGGKDPSDIKQYICLIFDDNAYSGLKKTPYEWKEACKWKELGRVGGEAPNSWENAHNPLNLQEGDMGMSWALGIGVKSTFNVISGQMAKVTGKWQPQGGLQKGWKDKQFETVDWGSLPAIKVITAPVCWGREYAVNDGTADVQPNWTKQMYEKVLSDGHELGDHTLDHMESNSGLPNDDAGFGKWGGEGFDDDMNEGEQYEPWEKIGWLINAGKKISVKAWKGAIELSEAELDEHLKATVANGKIFGFRAPRLEINSNCFLALKEIGFTYDCGLEEGWEDDMNGKNAWWPYTTDNGSQNVWTQTMFGEDMEHFKTWPMGLWEIPVNTFIVPEGIRDEVWAHGNEINDNAPDKGEWESLEDWKMHGRITGFDFNMYILWGMTCDQWLETMKYNLDLRIEGNKAPLHYGCHTDYYSTMYDFATLLSPYNKSSYGLVVTKGWNKWDGRKKALEDFIAYAKGKSAEFVTGKGLIDEMNRMMADEVVGNEEEYPTAEWEFFNNSALSSTASAQNFTGDISDVTVNVSAESGGEIPDAGFGAYENIGGFSNITHIAITYTTDTPLALRLSVEGDKPWEVVLNNLDTEVNSGKIPLYAFKYNAYNAGTNDEVDTDKINGIEVKVLTNTEKAKVAKFSVKSVKLYGVSTGIVTNNSIVSTKLIGLHEFTKSNMKLNIGKAGKYSVNILSANGRIVKSFNDVSMNAGSNNLRLDLPSGVYMIRVNSDKLQRNLKGVVL